MITRSQMRRQLRAKGGIMNVAPREKFLFGGLGDRLRKLIPNELANIAVKAAPFVAPFNPGIAAAMRGIGRYDQRGSISDALKQGLGTYGFGKAAGYLGGAQSDGGIFGGQTFSKEGFKSGPVGRLFQKPTVDPKSSGFQGAKETSQQIATGGTKIPGLESVQKATEFMQNIPIIRDLPPLVQQQILVGGVTSAGTYIYQKFLGEEPPQEEGETMEEYLARRKENVGKKMRAYFDNYFKFDKEYSSLDDAGKDAFVARYNMMSGGRAGYQTGGITMANTLAENIRRNLANQQAVGGMFEAARSRLPGYVAPQKTPAPTPTPVDTGLMTQALKKDPRAGIKEAFFNERLSGGERFGDAIPDFDKYGTYTGSDQLIKDYAAAGRGTPSSQLVKLPEGNPYAVSGPGYYSYDGTSFSKTADANMTPEYEKMIRSNYGINLPAPDSPTAEEGTLGPITKMPVEPDPNIPVEELIDGPIDEIDMTRPPGTPSGDGALTVMPQYNDPLPYDQLMAGFAEWKRNNPDKVSSIGTAAIVPVTLPGGYEVTYSGGAEANNMRQYLESIGQAPMQRREYSEPIKSIGDGSGLAKLAGGGMPMGEPRVNQGGVTELDYRAKGGFVPVGIKEKADDVPAMLSKNEFVFTADAVRGAGNGSIEKGAQKMYDTMKNLERRVT